MRIVAYYERVFAEEHYGLDVLESGLCLYDLFDDEIVQELTNDFYLTHSSGVNVFDDVEPIETSGSDWETDEDGDQETVYKLFPLLTNTVQYQPLSKQAIDTINRWNRGET